MATIIEGVEFTDLVSVDVPGGTNLLLTTSEDVYVFVPNGLFGDVVEIIANVNVLNSCAMELRQLQANGSTRMNMYANFIGRWQSSASWFVCCRS